MATKPLAGAVSGTALLAGLIASGFSLAALMAAKKHAGTTSEAPSPKSGAETWNALQTPKPAAPIPTGIEWIDAVNGHWNPSGIRTTHSRPGRLRW